MAAAAPAARPGSRAPMPGMHRCPACAREWPSALVASECCDPAHPDTSTGSIPLITTLTVVPAPRSPDWR